MADDINLPNLVSHLQVNLGNTSGLIADATRQGSSVGAAIGQSMQRTLRDAVDDIPDIPITGDSSDLDRDLARVRRDLDRLASQRIGVDISIEDALRRIEDLEPHLERLQRSHPSINVTASIGGALADLADLRDAARQVDDEDITIDVDVDTRDVDRRMDRVRDAIGRVVRAIGGLAGLAAPFATAGVAVGALLPLLASVVATLTQIAPAAAVGTSALLTMKLAAGTLQVAMIGVQEAIETAFDPEATPEELAEAMERLAPEARKFVTELRGMRDELDKIRERVQERFFTGFDDSLRSLSSAVLPQVGSAMERTADSLNRMAREAAASAVQLGERGILGRALDSATTSLETLEQVPGRAVTALGVLAAASGPALERIARKADEVSARMLESLVGAFESGKLERAIDGAIDAIAQLGRIGGNIFSGLGNIIGGVTGQGQGLFFILEQLSEAFERLTASKEFQSILAELVKTADSLVKNVLPILQEAFIQLAPVIEELGPPVRDFINQIGPELVPLLRELGPILKDIAEIFREQMPFAIQFTKAAIEALRLVLGLFHQVMEELILPIIRAVARVLNSDYTEAIAAASRMTADRIGNIVERFERFRSTVRDVIRNAVGRLGEFAVSVGSMAGGVFQAVGNVINQFRALPGQIRDAVGDLGSLLWNAGWRLIGGLIDGIRSRIPSLTGLLASITSMIPEVKGPPEKDARLLTPNGKLVMEGFIAGIESTTGRLRSRLSQITRDLPAMLAAGNLGPAMAGLGDVPVRSQVAAAYTAPVGPAGHTFNLYGSDATPNGILRAMSWNALVGGTSG